MLALARLKINNGSPADLELANLCVWASFEPPMEAKSVSIKLAIFEVTGSFPTKTSRQKKMILEHNNAHLSLMYLGTLTSHTSLVQLLKVKTTISYGI
jgi:hypothetical protein